MLVLEQDVGGEAGNTEVIHTNVAINAGDSNYTSVYIAPTIFNFTGGESGELIGASQASFTGIATHFDAVRVFADSKYVSVIPDSDDIGTLQTNNRPMRPKHYFDPRKFGQASDFFVQGRDSRSFRDDFGPSQPVFTDKIGLNLLSPVRALFVSGTVSSETGLRRFVRAQPSGSFNKTRNSLITGSFIDRK
jgi:hypothetical protein